MKEKVQLFEKRKQEHIRMALDPRSQVAHGLSGLDRIRLIHQGLVDSDFSDVNLKTSYLKGLGTTKVPLFVSSMTAGHPEALNLNLKIAKACSERGWAMGLGSIRRDLVSNEFVSNDLVSRDLVSRDLVSNDKNSILKEALTIREKFPDLVLFANLGVTQAITTSTEQLLKILDPWKPQALIVHFNSLQECLQPEGTPQFRGAIDTLKRLRNNCPYPLIIKEVGCGFSKAALDQLNELNLPVVDISGLGGTHWGRIEGLRMDSRHPLASVAESFQDWGNSTVQTLLNAVVMKSRTFEVWASGGVRSGLDAAKLMAMGAQMVGLAQPILKAAMCEDQGECLSALMAQWEQEIKIALFCTGCQNGEELRNKKEVWEWI